MKKVGAKAVEQFKAIQSKENDNKPSEPIEEPNVVHKMNNIYWSYEIMALDGSTVISTLNILDTIAIDTHLGLLESLPNTDPILHLLDIDVDVKKMEISFYESSTVKFKLRKSKFNNRARTRLNQHTAYS